MQTNDFSNLPTSWQIKTLGEVCVSTNSNITFKNIQDKKGDYPIYGASGVVAYVDFYTKENQSLGIVKDGAGIGRVFLLPPKASVIGTLHYVENNDDLNLKYLFYFLQSINLARYITGSAIPHIYFRDWKKEQIPLPPLEIQKRIVARLESAFEKIEKGSAHLQDAKTKLAKYKQSLLKSAFDGTLTATASLQGVEKAETIHKVDCHDLTSSKLAMTDKENPKLPQGWTIKTLGEVLSNDKYAIKRGPFGSSLKKNFFVKSGVRVFEQYNPINQDVEWKRYFITQEKFKELEAFKAGAGDLLISCSGTLGKILELPQNVEVGIINQALLKIRLDNTQILNSYFVHLFNSPYMQKIILENTLGSTIQNIASVKELKQIKIPLPPLETQKQIVKLLEKHLQHADKTGEFIESALNKAKQLKQSLLKSAFLGKLT